MKFQFNNPWNNPGSKDRLDLVFENRFKEYGAYKLRQQYNRNKVLAMLISFVLVGFFAACPLLFAKQSPPQIKTPPPGFIDTLLINEDPPTEDPPAKRENNKSSVNPDIIPQFNPTAAPTFTFKPDSGIFSGNSGNIGNGIDTDAPFENNNPGTKITIPTKHTAQKPYSMCTFGDNEEDFANFIRDNFVTPESCADIFEGYANIRFMVNEDGSISNVQILECSKSCPEFGNEIKRILSHCPLWRPATSGGIAVKCWRDVPVHFSLE